MELKPQEEYFLELCHEAGMPEEAAVDSLDFYVRGHQDGRFVYAMESGLAEYDAALEGFGCLGEAGFVNCIGVFDEWDAQHQEDKLYSREQILDQYFTKCREQGWRAR